MKTILRLFGLLLLAGAWAPALSAGSAITADDVIAPVTTRHEVTIGGVRIPYLATFAEHVLADEKGEPQATISATSYVRADVANRASRAVVFFFNGGPGASSSPLHFGALGPRLRTERDARGRRRIAENPSSLVDA
ncbi:MAG TPA: hypothetical protein VE175_01795, partial [Woeseiaceae bacterium]|nr:hypothetical protein [Woeseiaceae bacterium]